MKNAVKVTTMNIFLTRPEKDNLVKWTYSVKDESITTEILTPLWEYLVRLVPPIVAPNVLTLCGFLAVLYAHHLCYNYLEIYPNLIAIVTCVLTFIYMNLDAMDGKHARRTRNSTPLGELFDHACDNVGLVFMTQSLCMILGIDTYLQWYIVQIAQFAFLNSHLDAMKSDQMYFGRYTGPGEILFAYMGLILGHVFIGHGWIVHYFGSLLSGLVVASYYAAFLFTMAKIFLTMYKFYATQNGLFISLTLRFVPSIMMYAGMMGNEVSHFDVICHGLIMSILTGDIIVAKMAKRDLHPLVPVMVMISLFNNFFCVALCIGYYVIMLTEIAHYLRISIFAVKQNVYCNGVFDLTHAGHMELFDFAAKHGNRVIVGVHSDEDVASYKRTPTMSHSERCDTVRKCRYVDEVIENAPLITDEDFIKRNDIHVVVCSSEYDTPDDKYYDVPRKMGILVVKPRSEGISTTDIRKRLQSGS